jgi:hypothetical protein
VLGVSSQGRVCVRGIKPGKGVVMYVCVGVSSQGRVWSCICVLGYQAREGCGHVCVCWGIKPGKGVVMYLCVGGYRYLYGLN